MGQRNSRLVLLVSLLFYLTVVSFAAVFLWRGYEAAVERTEIQATTAAEAVAAHAQWLVEASGQALRRVDDVLVILEADQAVERVAADLPPGFQLAIYGRNALQSFPDNSSGGLSEADINALSEGLADSSMIVSHFLPDAADGEGGFLVARAIAPGDAGERLAVVLIPTGTVSEFWRALGLGPDSAISIVRRDGRLVTRHPVPEDALDLANHRLFTEYLGRADAGVYHSAVSPADGIARIVAYSTVRDLPLITIAAISRKHALAPFWQRVYLILLLGIPVLFLLAALGWWQARLLRRDNQTRHQLQETAEHNHLLLREVHHRVKNNLQIIVSLIRMQKLPSESERDLRNRIMAMSVLHEHLQGTGPAGRIAIGSYLRRIFESVNGAYGDRLTLHLNLADDLFVDADVATPLGLIANELMTNANKYAYPDCPPGTMTVILTALPENRAELAICNDGIPFDAKPPSSGEGIRLIRSLANQVDPAFVFTGNQGLEFRIRMQLSLPKSSSKLSPTVPAG